MPEHYKTAPPPAARREPAENWWREFRSPELDRLESADRNRIIRITRRRWRVTSAPGRCSISRQSAFYPTVVGAPSLSFNKQSQHRPLRSANQPTYYGANQLLGPAFPGKPISGAAIRDLVAAAKAGAQANDDLLAAVRAVAARRTRAHLYRLARRRRPGRPAGAHHRRLSVGPETDAGAPEAEYRAADRRRARQGAARQRPGRRRRHRARPRRAGKRPRRACPARRLLSSGSPRRRSSPRRRGLRASRRPSCCCAGPMSRRTSACCLPPMNDRRGQGGFPAALLHPAVGRNPVHQSGSAEFPQQPVELWAGRHRAGLRRRPEAGAARHRAGGFQASPPRTTNLGVRRLSGGRGRHWRRSGCSGRNIRRWRLRRRRRSARSTCR